MKVYVVTSGEYSDYQIQAIFSTREKAQAYIDYVEPLGWCYRCNEIEQYELDIPLADFMGVDVFMDVHGNTRRCNVDISSGHGFCSMLVDSNSMWWLHWNVAGTDMTRAVKVVNEKRAQLIAAGLWGKPEEARAFFHVQR